MNGRYPKGLTLAVMNAPHTSVSGGEGNNGISSYEPPYYTIIFIEGYQ